MQKISSYLYSNTIQVNFDLDALPTEWRIVYQRTVKIYKGYDNVIELDIKNAQQRRFNVSSKTMKVLIMDDLGKEVVTADVTHSSTPGLATFTISADDVEYLSPQFLNYTVYVLNPDTTKNIIYGDTQFGATGKMELLGTSAVQIPKPQEIRTFNHLENTVGAVGYYYSEAVVIHPKNDINLTLPLVLEFTNSGLEADIDIQITRSKVISSETEWDTLETFHLASSTINLTKTYACPTDYSADVNWLRIRYLRDTANTGKIDKILVSQ